MGASGSKQEARSLLEVFRSSKEILVCKNEGFQSPTLIPVDDPQLDGALEDRLGDIPSLNKDEKKIVKPPYGPMLTNGSGEDSDMVWLELAIALCDVPTVKALLEKHPALATTKLPLSKQLPLVYSAQQSTCSDAFYGTASGGLSTNRRGPDGKNYFRQTFTEDVLACIKMILLRGGEVTEDVLRAASTPAFSKPKTQVLLLLRQFASVELREQYPVYKPNTEPLLSKLEVTDVIKGATATGPCLREMADHRVEGTSPIALGMCVIFTNAQGLIDIFACAKSRGDVNFHKGLLYLRSIKPTLKIAPDHITYVFMGSEIALGLGIGDARKTYCDVFGCDQLKAASYDSLEYVYEGPLCILDRGKMKYVPSADTVRVVFNALNDWDSWRVSGLKHLGFRSGFRSQPSLHIDSRVVIQYGRGNTRPLVVVGLIQGIADGVADGVTPIATEFYVVQPKVLYPEVAKEYFSASKYMGLHWNVSVDVDETAEAKALKSGMVCGDGRMTFTLGVPSAPNQSLNGDCLLLTKRKDVDGVSKKHEVILQMTQASFPARGSRMMKFECKDAEDQEYKNKIVELKFVSPAYNQSPAATYSSLVTPGSNEREGAFNLLQELSYASPLAATMSGSAIGIAIPVHLSLKGCVLRQKREWTSFPFDGEGVHMDEPRLLETPFVEPVGFDNITDAEMAKLMEDIKFIGLDDDVRAARVMEMKEAKDHVFSVMQELRLYARKHNLPQKEFVQICQLVASGMVSPSDTSGQESDLGQALGQMGNMMTGLAEGLGTGCATQ